MRHGTSRLVSLEVNASAAIRLERALGDQAAGLLTSVLFHSDTTVPDLSIALYAEDPAVNASAVPVAVVKILLLSAVPDAAGESAAAGGQPQVVSGYVGVEDATHARGDLWAEATATGYARFGFTLDG